MIPHLFNVTRRFGLRLLRADPGGQNVAGTGGTRPRNAIRHALPSRITITRADLPF